MNLRKHIALGFTLLLTLILSEQGLHSILHESHHHEEHHEVCDGHHHESDENADTLCSHEHQCKLCVLIQSNTHFLPEVETEGFSTEYLSLHFSFYEDAVCTKLREVSSPRAPPVA